MSGRRFVTEDPIGIAGGINLYGYVGADPVGAIDPSGLDTYIVNRDLARFGDSPRSRSDPITHTFVVTTAPDGSVVHTYSWGTDANLRGWTMDFALDRTTAREALTRNLAERVGSRQLDYFVAAAYRELNRPENEHLNGIVRRNCKAETTNLINRAYQLSSPY